jgi:ammonium transporter Rh
MLGSMVLWVFWPSFCSAIVPEADFEKTVVNTVLALCGATIITYVFSTIFRKGKPSIADIANASLAGGVSIGATCNLVSAPTAFLIGILAGGICVIGYAFIQPILQKYLKIVDTCGVHNLHGMPGLLGGIIAVFVVPEAAKAQIMGILFTICLALVGGIVVGNIVKLTGSKEKIYEDSDEFSEA